MDDYIIDTRLIPWPLSRMGAQIYKEPYIIEKQFLCLNSSSSANDTQDKSAGQTLVIKNEINVDNNFVGFVPINQETSHCVGQVDKVEATQICSTVGGSLM